MYLGSYGGDRRERNFIGRHSNRSGHGVEEVDLSRKGGE